MGWGQIIGGSLGSLAGSIGAGIGSGIGGFFDQQQSNDYNSSQAAASRQWSEHMASTQYQRTMKDLEAAGLNPMLVIGNGSNNVPIGGSASFSSNVDSSGNSATAFMHADSALSTADSARRRTDADIVVAGETVQKIGQEIRKMSSETDRNETTIRLIFQQYLNAKQEGLNLQQINNQIRTTVDKMKAEIHNISVNNILQTAQALQADNQATLSRLDIDAAQNMGNAGRNMGQLKPFFDVLIGILKSSR